MMRRARWGVLPNEDDGQFLLVLRNAKKTKHENIVDISGQLFVADPALSTNIWPPYCHARRERQRD